MPMRRSRSAQNPTSRFGATEVSQASSAWTCAKPVAAAALSAAGLRNTFAAARRASVSQCSVMSRSGTPIFTKIIRILSTRQVPLGSPSTLYVAVRLKESDAQAEFPMKINGQGFLIGPICADLLKAPFSIFAPWITHGDVRHAPDGYCYRGRRIGRLA